MIELLAVRDLADVWRQLVASIAPALKREGRSSWEVLDQLVSGNAEGWVVSGPAKGFAITSVGYVENSDTKACWLLFVGGQVFGGPHQRVTAGKALLGIFEDLARRCGCAEMRLETRGAWRHVLADYQNFGRSGPYTLFRKALQ
jgi:hypothetical protein